MSVLKTIRFYISPYFFSKAYLLRDVRFFTTHFSFQGKVLDVGCGEKPYKYLFSNSDYRGIDFHDYSINKDFVGEPPDHFFGETYHKTSVLPFDTNSFDHVVSFQVLEHHHTPHALVEESVRITRPGGYVLFSVPFLGGLHEEPHDYQRYTKYGLKKLFTDHNCDVIQIKEQGSLCSTISLLLNEHLNYFAAKSRFHYLLGILFYPPFLLFQYIALLLDQIIVTDKIVFNYMILAQKR